MKKQALNPFLPIDEYIPDGEPHVFGDRVYLYGSHDKENGDTFCMLDYVVWSAPVNDLGNWTNKGISYSPEKDPYYSETMKYMYAPDCVRGNDGRYYLYYCLSGDKGQGGYANPVSVAVSDEPDGPFNYLGFVKNKEGKPYLRYLCFDPAVMNDSGTIRLCFGSYLHWLNSVCPKFIRDRVLARATGRSPEQVKDGIMGAYVCELEDDMLTLKKEAVRIDDSIRGEGYKEHAFFEGSSIRRIDGNYYFIYSSIRNHELCYAVSRHPDRDYCYGGILVSNGDIGYQGRKEKDRLNMTGTNHGSIEKINGQWYVFYHRLTHQSDYSRQACAEKISINEDGSISQVEITSCGLNDGPLKAEGSYPAVICCNLTNGHMPHGSNTKKNRKIPYVCSGNNQRFVHDISDRCLIAYKYFVFKGNTRICLRARNGEGCFEISNDGKRVLGKIECDGSASWKDYRTAIDLDGVYPLYLTYRGKDKCDLLTISFE